MENKKVQTDVLLPVAMLALFSTVCAYGALASLVNVVFSQRLLPMGPSMFQVGISRTNQSVSEIQCFFTSTLSCFSGSFEVWPDSGEREEGNVSGAAVSCR